MTKFCRFFVRMWKNVVSLQSLKTCIYTESTNAVCFCHADKKRLQPTYMNDDGLFIVNLIDFLMNPAKFIGE